MLSIFMFIWLVRQRTKMFGYNTNLLLFWVLFFVISVIIFIISCYFCYYCYYHHYYYYSLYGWRCYLYFDLFSFLLILFSRYFCLYCYFTLHYCYYYCYYYFFYFQVWCNFIVKKCCNSGHQPVVLGIVASLFGFFFSFNIQKFPYYSRRSK